MRKYLFLISFMWKLIKGLDKRLLNTGFLISLLKVENSPVEIIVPVRKVERKADTIDYGDLLILHKNKLMVRKYKVQKIRSSLFSELPPFVISLN